MHHMKVWTVTADDYGLTRGVTDTILETADTGVLTRVSVLANGLAFDYAIDQLRTRPVLELSLHLNLSEGKPVSAPREIPHLVDSDGMFRYSPTQLLLKTLFASASLREDLAREIRHEMRAQIERVRSAVPDREFSIDGHQHIHMVPLVFAQLISLHTEYRFHMVRIPYEVFFLDLSDWRSYISPAIVRHVGLNILSLINRRHADRVGLAYLDHFIGSLMSGHITHSNLKRALEAAASRGAESLEVGIHPGVALSGELATWKGNRDWYYAVDRTKEHDLLLQPSTRNLLGSFSEGSLRPGVDIKTLFRFFVSGITSTLVVLGLLYALTEWAGWWYVTSAICAFAIAIVVSFLLQKFWTFGDHGLGKVKQQFSIYIGLNLINLLLNTTGLYLVVEYMHVWYVLAEVIVAGIVAVWSYVIMRFAIFKGSHR